MNEKFPANPFINSLSELSFDVQSLTAAYLDLRKKTDFHSQFGQISLRTRKLEKAPQHSWYDGTGSLLDPKTGQLSAQESEFTEVHPQVIGSYFETLLRRIEDKLPFAVGRMRLMRILPRACYSFHVDTEIRLHFPIQTNPQSFLLFLQGFPVHLPADGSCFWVDTRKAHSAMNGDLTKERVHLVLSLIEKEKNQFDRFIVDEMKKARPYERMVATSAF